MPDLTAPIRKLEKAARQHEGIARMDRDYAEQCGDVVESQLTIEDAKDHEAMAESYYIAAGILSAHQERSEMEIEPEHEVMATISLGGSVFRGACMCQWLSVPVSDRKTAIQAVEAHVREVGA